MKKILIIILFQGFTVGSLAQNFSEHYYELKALFESTEDTQNEVIFLGNSITEGGEWKALFPHKNVVNRGISGDVTDGILFRLDEVTSSKPLKVFLLIGTNDLARGKDILYVVNGIHQIIERILQESNNTNIYLQSILPVNPNVGDKFSGHKANQNKIAETNEQLEILAETLNVKFINLHRALRNRQGQLKAKFTYDGLHLNEKGYLKWKRIINKYVN